MGAAIQHTHMMKGSISYLVTVQTILTLVFMLKVFSVIR